MANVPVSSVMAVRALSPPPGPKPMPWVATLPPVQLYDLAADIGERNNVQDKHPEIVARLTRLLERYVADGRSTPGAKQANTVPVDIWKAAKETPKAAAKKKKKAA